MRLGDLDALIAEVDESIFNLAFTSPYQDEIERVRDGMERVRDYINNAPTIDAIEVVRCKDCNYFTLHHDRTGRPLVYGKCRFRSGELFGINAFCSYGERRIDDERKID